LNKPQQAGRKRQAGRYIYYLLSRRLEMNWDEIAGKWKQSTGKVKEKWGKLTDDDLTVINGKREQLVGKIQERYGIAKDAAEKQVDEFVGSSKAAKAKSV
jgi:uncharacterized protein YjbJ (UPF0337 family)